MGNEIQMSKYYEFRKAIRNLYDNDTKIGDLCCKILEIRDKYRYVESITTSIQEYNIDIELENGTDQDKKEKILTKVADAVGRYLVDNQTLLDPSIYNDPEFELFIESDNYIFCDIYVVGNSIKFTL